MRTLTIIAFLLTLGISCLLLDVPVYSGQTSTNSTKGWAIHDTHATLMEVNGQWALSPLTIPVSIVLMPMIFPKVWVYVVGTVVLGLCVFLAGYSIGLFYLPSTVLLFAATVLRIEAYSAERGGRRDRFP
jgi:hypothetical protein